MNQEPDRPVDMWDSGNPPTARLPAPETAAPVEMPPYPRSAGHLVEPYPHYRPAPPMLYPPSNSVPQAFPQPAPPVLMVQQFHPGVGQVVVKRSFPHGLHLVLTLLTCGLWSPIWLIHYLLADNS